MLSENDPSFQNLKFLILIMQIIYLFNLQWVVASLGPNQTQFIKELTVLCGGMLTFVTVTIKFVWTRKDEADLNDIEWVEHKHVEH